MIKPPSIDQLRKAVKIADQIQKLEQQLATILGGSPAPARKAAAPKAKRRKRSKLSAAGRAAIIKAQKARWAKAKKLSV